MFQLIATITFLMNGVPASDPLKAVARQTFETREACDTFKDSEENKASLAKLSAQIQLLTAEKPGATHKITNACEAAKDDTI